MSPDQIIELILQTIGLATILLQVIPTLDKKNKFKPVLEFIGRYIALNKPVIREHVDRLVRK